MSLTSKKKSMSFLKVPSKFIKSASERTYHYSVVSNKTDETDASVQSIAGDVIQDILPACTCQSCKCIGTPISKCWLFFFGSSWNAVIDRLDKINRFSSKNNQYSEVLKRRMEIFMRNSGNILTIQELFSNKCSNTYRHSIKLI